MIWAFVRQCVLSTYTRLFNHDTACTVGPQAHSLLRKTLTLTLALRCLGFSFSLFLSIVNIQGATALWRGPRVGGRSCTSPSITFQKESASAVSLCSLLWLQSNNRTARVHALLVYSSRQALFPILISYAKGSLTPCHP